MNNGKGNCNYENEEVIDYHAGNSFSSDDFYRMQNKKLEVNPEEEIVNIADTEIIPAPLSEGTQLMHFYITHQGMQSGLHYILKTTDTGTILLCRYCKRL